MTVERKAAGRAGEQNAVDFLRSQGYRIVGTNIRPMPGLARGELDIVAYDGEVLCFIEVKARRTQWLPPDLGITLTKRNQIIKVADAYLSVNNLDPEQCRFDVVSVWSDPSLPAPMATLHKDAFGLD